MTLEAKIIAAAALSRPAFEAAKDAVDITSWPVLYVPVWNAIAEYYAHDTDAQTTDRDVLLTAIAATGAGDKKSGALRRHAEELLDTPVSAANITALLRDQARDSAGMRLAAAIAGRKAPDEIETLARGYITLIDTPTQSEAENVHDWDTVLHKRLDVTQRIKISPPCLNKRLKGGVVPGTMIGVLARPNDGKSALALTIACGFMRRGLRGLYLGNEDPIASMMARAAANLSGMTEEEMSADPDQASRIAIEKGARNGVFRDLIPSTPAEIERLVKRYKPQWLVVDQIRNLRIKDADGTTAALDQAGQRVRDITKKYGLVTVCVSQAGDSATNKAIVGMSDFDSSKTGLPGAFDVIIGIGSTDTLRDVGQRMFNLCKNKVSAVHEYWQVTLDPYHSKYVSIK